MAHLLMRSVMAAAAAACVIVCVVVQEKLAIAAGRAALDVLHHDRVDVVELCEVTRLQVCDVAAAEAHGALAPEG